MRWAEEDFALYEQARLAYARLISEYGDTDELLFRMLRYFIRVDNEEEVLVLKDLFVNDPGADIVPEVYAELGGYLIDKDRIADVRQILFRALDEEPVLPEAHYHLARLFRELAEPRDERTALENAIRLFEFTDPVNPRSRALYVDSHTRFGEFFYDNEEFLQAETQFDRARELYEQSVERGVLEPEFRFGRIYNHLGNIAYYESLDYAIAEQRFNQAEANRYDTATLQYKQGYLDYRGRRFDEALDRFLAAAGPFSANENLNYATANTLYYRENYFAAQGYYMGLLERLQQRRSRIPTLLADEDPDHRSLLEYLIRVNTNLGVTLERLAQLNANPNSAAERRSEALVHLNRANELAVNFARDPETAVRGDTVNLAFLNQRKILYPESEFELQIYNEIPKDFDRRMLER
jgi:tetratricopeptide (TPR) repeat protein